MYGDTDYGRRGLMKLMMRMPALRGQLQILAVRDEHFLSLCGAFEDASITLEALQSVGSEREASKVSEYERVCSEIEAEVIAICYQAQRGEGSAHR